MSICTNLYKDIVLKERAACPNTGTKRQCGNVRFYKDIVSIGLRGGAVTVAS